MSDDEIVISVKNVSKDFKLTTHKASTLKSAFANVFQNRKETRESQTQHALKNISFEIKKGEFFGIVGRNGSGKSTLLKMLAGIYQPNKGTVQVKGKLVPFIELGVGFNPELTGRENVYLNGALLGFSKTEVDEFYNEVVAFAELEKFMEQKLKNYSSGMQVRLAFAMAIRAQADILLIDEVLAVGDADFQRKCFEHFKSLKKNKTTVVFVSHDMDAVRQYCDKAILVEKSKLIQIGSSSEIGSAYTKMFTKNSGIETHITKKWGDGSANIEKPNMRGNSKSIKLTFIIEAKTDLQNAIYGFSLKDSQGRSIIGTNTRLNDNSQMNLLEGGKKKVTCTFDNILNDGDYLVDLAVLAEDGVGVKCWWQDAAGITIKKDKRLPSILNFPITITEEAE